MSRAAFIRIARTCALALAFAQSSGAHAASSDNASDPTREAVRNDLAQYRCAGYNPIADEINYPNDVDAARERLQHAGCEPPNAAPGRHKPGDGQSK
ncbi:DUF4148 domain-containing protein [Caballeronia sp. Lep1P3]|uniref:DUF4148 domain-containing protein n=1 Tax=Caballeronia sp. Lep1P3 TaxID=2878150 RepID=UPI001FD11378|nr:DUF4148 domain-containing protein [Caballeronia sp. Lep1P3]